MRYTHPPPLPPQTYQNTSVPANHIAGGSGRKTDTPSPQASCAPRSTRLRRRRASPPHIATRIYPHYQVVVVVAEKTDTPSPSGKLRAPLNSFPPSPRVAATHSSQDLPSLASTSSSRKTDTPSPSANLLAHSTRPRRRRASPRTPPPIHTQRVVATILHPALAPTTRHTHTGRDTISSSRREQ